VVTKLFNVIQPERAYFGQKDVQQTVVLKALIRDLHIPIDLRVCPTVREHDGLALSSRNAYLNPSQRSDALILWHALKVGLDTYATHANASAATIIHAARRNLARDIDKSQGKVSLDYFDIVHPETLQVLADTCNAKGGILVGAIYLRGRDRTIRLIDNVILE
jgi:pantoate--beta-alanine ligase